MTEYTPIGLESIELHKHGGKLSVESTLPVSSREDLSRVYTPGVGAVSEYIHEHPEAKSSL